ncbi:hypothetical protein P691DRAFT_813192, partial [Macrolepiota fuliginosa MF-IS2]
MTFIPTALITQREGMIIGLVFMSPKSFNLDTGHVSQQYLAPTLMDLLNEDNVLPLDMNIEQQEAEWFD